MATALRTRLLRYLHARLGGLPLRLVLWDGAVCDFAPAPRITIGLRSRRLVRFFLTGNIGRLAAAYVAGELVVEGSIGEVIAIGMELAQRIGGRPMMRRAAAVLGRLPRRHSKAADADWVRYHYDVSNAFYPVARSAHDLFLRLFHDRWRRPRHRAGAQARSHLPQIAARTRRPPARHRLRLGRAFMLGRDPLRGQRSGHYLEPAAMR